MVIRHTTDVEVVGSPIAALGATVVAMRIVAMRIVAMVPRHVMVPLLATVGRQSIVMHTMVATVVITRAALDVVATADCSLVFVRVVVMVTTTAAVRFMVTATADALVGVRVR